MSGVLVRGFLVRRGGACLPLGLRLRAPLRVLLGRRRRPLGGIRLVSRLVRRARRRQLRRQLRRRLPLGVAAALRQPGP